MSLMTRLASALSTYREAGFSGLAKEVAGKVVERTEFVAMQRDLALPAPEVGCKVAFEIRRVNDEVLSGFRSMPEPFPRHYEYRLQYDQRHCYGAWIGDRIVALMWPFFQADNEAMVTQWRFLLPDEARVSNIWADPEYRGTGLMAACIERFAAHLRGAGIRYLYCFTWVQNHASIKLHEKLGFRTVGRIVRYSFWWQKEGRGIYRRDPVPRIEAGAGPGDVDLPDVIAP